MIFRSNLFLFCFVFLLYKLQFENNSNPSRGRLPRPKILCTKWSVAVFHAIDIPKTIRNIWATSYDKDLKLKRAIEDIYPKYLCILKKPWKEKIRIRYFAQSIHVGHADEEKVRDRFLSDHSQWIYAGFYRAESLAGSGHVLLQQNHHLGFWEEWAGIFNSLTLYALIEVTLLSLLIFY